jgi:hypothetical protein
VPGGKWQISTGGGSEPRWRRDGKELFYIAPDGKLMMRPIQGTGQILEAGTPVTLFQTRIGRNLIPQKCQYAVSPDGQRFLNQCQRRRVHRFTHHRSHQLDSCNEETASFVMSLSMTLAPGTKLGPYEIAPIGAGGMGEIWKARDTRLGRNVAIKKVKEQHSERFKQEARAIAALNHPYICQLHDIGPDYLVLEYVKGKPLSIPLPEREAVRLAIQIATALEAAHKKGIIHRDLNSQVLRNSA